MKSISAGFLLKSVLGLLAGALFTLLGTQVMTAWSDYRESSRAADVVETSRQIFTVLVNQRTDRSSTLRTWVKEGAVSATTKADMAAQRGAEMPALDAVLAALPALSSDGKDTLPAELRSSTEALRALQAEYDAHIAEPLASRRPGLGGEYVRQWIATADTLQRLALSLFDGIRSDDALIARMMEIKQFAWLTRETAGEASLVISQALAAGSVTPDQIERHATMLGGARSLWSVIDEAASGHGMPAGFVADLAQAKATLFDPSYLGTHQKLLAALSQHATPDMNADQWSHYTVPKLGVTMDVANAALAQAAARARVLRGDAMIRLLTRVVGLIVALAASAAGYLIVTRRVTGPLRILRETTQRLAQGDLTAVAPFAGRGDELGALADALDSFRGHAVAKSQMEQEQREQRARADARRDTVEGLIKAFDGDVSSALSELDQASSQMDATAATLLRAVEQAERGVRSAGSAAGEAFANVSGIAAATEELSASIDEISRQVQQSALISRRAVAETQQTDETVRGLADSAARIGDVVKLISDIAGQTNLLALNATIEAARAGDAGKGFAVVASEVKSLANQTAKATDEIASQISQVRGVTQDAVQAIQQIRATIDEVNKVATAIAASIEQQGAAMQQIARGTQLAADRTRDATSSVGAVSESTAATAESAGAVKSAAGSLATQAGRLRRQVDGFMQRIRAA